MRPLFMKKTFLYFVAAVIMSSCGSKELKNTEHTEETVAEIEAAQMMGRDAAKDFVSKQWDDTLALQRDLMNVRAVQSRYVIDNKKKCAAAFDTAFVSTMRTVRPELYEHLSKYLKRDSNPSE